MTRLIDRNALYLYLNDLMLSERPNDGERTDIKRRQNAICKGIKIAMDAVAEQKDVPCTAIRFSRWRLDQKIGCYVCEACNSPSARNTTYCPNCGTRNNGGTP